MFRYCIDVLNLSEAEAYRRIGAARLSRKYPVLLTMLEDGRIHLCGIAVLAKHLTEANYENVLARATHKSKRELEELVAELAPKPDVPPTVRKRPQRKAQSKPPTSSSEASADNAERPEPPPAPEPPVAQEKRAKVEPLSPARYKVEFTASAELRDKLERLEALMPGSDLAAIIDAAVSEKLERLEAKRFGKTSRPRRNAEDADTLPGVRGISAPVKRIVWATRSWSMYLCRCQRQTMSRAPSARVPSRRALCARRRPQRGKYQTPVQGTQSLHCRDGLREGKDGLLPERRRPGA